MCETLGFLDVCPEIAVASRSPADLSSSPLAPSDLPAPSIPQVPARFFRRQPGRRCKRKNGSNAP